MTKSACFFARVSEPAVLERVEFYAQDIQILRELGYDVRIATRPHHVRPADLGFIWWWTWAPFPLIPLRLARTPSIVTGTVDWGQASRRPWLRRRAIELALRVADANVFVSKFEFEQIPRMRRVTNPQYSPHVVATDVYVPSHEEREDLVLTVAWMHRGNAHRKCIPEVIKAAAIVHEQWPHIRFVIAGERGSDFPELLRLARSLGAERFIEFPGNISRERKIDLMQRCKVYLQPSRFEGFGLAILEAMSCGSPVVTSPVGAVPEVVDQTALLVDGTAPQAIAASVRRLLEDPGLRADLSGVARARAESQFPFSRRKRDLQRIIEHVR